MEREQLTEEKTGQDFEIQTEPPRQFEETSYEETPTESACDRCAAHLSNIDAYISGNNAPLTAAGWIWVNLAMLITPLNVILLFLWAGGGTERVALKNFARGFLLTLVVLTLVFLGVVLVRHGIS